MQEKEMEIGFAGFLFFVWSKMEEKKEKEKKEERKKNEDGSVLAGQAGMEVVGWREIVGLV